MDNEYPIIYKALSILGGAGFLHQLYVVEKLQVYGLHCLHFGLHVFFSSISSETFLVRKTYVFS